MILLRLPPGRRTAITCHGLLVAQSLLLLLQPTRARDCPTSLVSFIEQATSRPRSCSRTVACPRGYSCVDNVCCGTPGRCPNPYTTLYMVDGGPRACTSSLSCPRSSRCLPSTTLSQSLCCASLDCPSPSRPVNDRLQLCDTSSDCPEGSECQTSPTATLTRLCCSAPSRPRTATTSNSRNVCPAGWVPHGAKVTACSLSGDMRECSRGASCVESPIGRNEYFCCVPATVSSSLPSSSVLGSCVDGKVPELRAGLPRECSIEAPVCSKGFSCERTSLSTFMCCPSSLTVAQQASFSCPGVGQTPALSQGGGNLYCSQAGVKDTCPQNALCQSAANSIGMLICCYSGLTTPTCPNNGIPQPSVSGYAACDAATASTQCDPGYSCVRAANDYNVQMCCSSTTINQPICPNQGQLLQENGRPAYCSPSQVAPCSSGYTCEAAVGTTGTYVCCSSSTSGSPSCPTSFQPSLDTQGSPIYCSPNQPAGCPGGSMCLQTPQSDQLFLCCRSTVSPRVCPNGQNALLTSTGSLETCTGPGSPCSKSGYTCQLSSVLAQWVCCGADSATAKCADGSETYEQIAGETYSCSVLSFPSNCPAAYTCAPSSISGLNVCCRQTGTDTNRCPAGWNPYRNEVTRETRSCASAVDESCPPGYSCTPSSASPLPTPTTSSSSSFTCCRLADSPRCPAGTAFLLNSQPRLCSPAKLNQCPVGYQCTTSTVPSVSICCNTSPIPAILSVVCPDGSPPAMLGSNPRHCPNVGVTEGCPAGYICLAINNMQTCCKRSIRRSYPITRRSQVLHVPITSAVKVSPCGIGAEPLLHNDAPVGCHNAPDVCPISHPCRRSSLTGLSFCCQEAQCPNGVRVGPNPVVCRSTNDCPPTAQCERASNLDHLRVCCAVASESDARCLGRGTQMRAGLPVSCIIGSVCLPPFECSSLTSNGSPLCCESAEDAISTCPESRIPIRLVRSDETIFCGGRTAKQDCPSDYECLRAKGPQSRSVCCSAIPSCPDGRPAMVGTNREIKRCFMHETLSECDAGFECSETSVQDLFACCLIPSPSKYNSSLISATEFPPLPLVEPEEIPVMFKRRASNNRKGRPILFMP